MDLGYSPFQVPSCQHDAGPTPTRKACALEPCMVCGYCERFGCEHFAKSSPQTTIAAGAAGNRRTSSCAPARTCCRVNLTPDGSTRPASPMSTSPPARSVPAGRARGAVRLRLPQRAAAAALRHRHALRPGQRRRASSGATTPTRPWAASTCSTTTTCTSTRSWAPGALGTAIDRLHRRQLRPRAARLRRRRYIAAYTTGARPIEFHPAPPGTPRWGLGMEAGGRAPLQPHRRVAACTARRARAGRTTSISTRPTATRTGSRCCGSPSTSPTTTSACRATHRPRRRDRAGDGRRQRSAVASAHGALLGRAVPDDAQHRRRDHGRRPRNSVVNRYLPVLGRAERVRHRRRACSRRTPATTRPARSARWPIGRPTRCATST